MEDHCSPLSWAYFYQDEGIEEFRHCLLYITELEATIVSAKEEITTRELEIDNLKGLLTKTTKERNEAQIECQKLMQEKLETQKLLLKSHQKEPQILQKNQQLQEEMQFLKQEAPPVSITSSNEDCDPPNCVSVVNDPFLNSSLPEVILKLAAERPLPQKGKLLQAVKDAGPLLQTLLLAGPLPQWQHPPPQLDSIEIPPVTISSPTAGRLVHQDSFNSFNACVSKKKGLEILESLNSSSSPTNKHQKTAFNLQLIQEF